MKKPQEWLYYMRFTLDLIADVTFKACCWNDCLSSENFF